MVVMSPGDPIELVKAVKAAAEHVGPVYFRVGSPPIPVLYDSQSDCRFRIGPRDVVSRWTARTSP